MKFGLAEDGWEKCLEGVAKLDMGGVGINNWEVSIEEVLGENFGEFVKLRAFGEGREAVEQDTAAASSKILLKFLQSDDWCSWSKLFSSGRKELVDDRLELFW